MALVVRETTVTRKIGHGLAGLRGTERGLLLLSGIGHLGEEDPAGQKDQDWRFHWSFLLLVRMKSTRRTSVRSATIQ